MSNQNYKEFSLKFESLPGYFSFKDPTNLKVTSYINHFFFLYTHIEIKTQKESDLQVSGRPAESFSSGSIIP